MPCPLSTKTLVPRQLSPQKMPRGQEGPEGVQPCLGPDERSEPGDFHVHTQHRPRFRGRIAQGGTTGRPGMPLDIIAAPCGTPVGVALAVALPCRTGQTRYRAGASPAPTGRSVCHSTPAGPGGVRVSNLSEGSLRSPPAKHGSTPLRGRMSCWHTCLLTGGGDARESQKGVSHPRQPPYLCYPAGAPLPPERHTCTSTGAQVYHELAGRRQRLGWAETRERRKVARRSSAGAPPAVVISPRRAERRDSATRSLSPACWHGRCVRTGKVSDRSR